MRSRWNVREFIASYRSKWKFGQNEAIDYLKSQRDSGMPAWKRLKIVEGLISYSQLHPGVLSGSLESVRIKLTELVAKESLEESDIPMEDVIGKINPRESDAIQAFRRRLRLMGRAHKTEKAYVGKVRSFMAERGLTCLNDFAEVNEADIESHLTDLAVEKEVAPSTQNKAFHSLRFFFVYMLKQERGEIDATRSTKKPCVPWREAG